MSKSKNKSKNKSDLFHSKELLKLYNGGQLDVVLDQFSDVINQENFLGGGGDASGFLYNEGTQVLKLCLKNIGYFKRYGHMTPHEATETETPMISCDYNRRQITRNQRQIGGTLSVKKGGGNPTQAQQFKEHINSYSSIRGFLVPIEEILYEDENVFIYTQKRCQLLKKDSISPRIVIGVIQMIQFMLRKNILVTDISPHNLGLLKGQVVLFDYHGLHPFQRRDGTIKRRKWCGRILRNLARYLSYIYAPEKIAEYTQLMQSVDHQTIKKLKSDGLLPSSFIRLAIYVNLGGVGTDWGDSPPDFLQFESKENQKGINKKGIPLTNSPVDKLFDFLQNIILDILHSFHFQSKQLSRIRCLCNLCIEAHDIGNDNVDDYD